MIDITAELVRTLVSDQFPEWSDLPVSPVDRQGWDNRTFRLGEQLTVRLPSAEGYVAAVAKEDRCLPHLAEQLSLPVPEPVAVGRPAAGYPFPWSVRRWLPGDTVEASTDIDRTQLARDLGDFLTELREAPAHQGPAAGRHSYFRGCHPSVYGDEVEGALDRLKDVVDVGACREIWASALTSAWPLPPTWFHGDVSVGNLLATGGALSAVIDFGSSGVGDPACDLVIAWNHFVGEERKVFREAVGLPEDAWRRARGWALWKALVSMAGLSSPDPDGTQSRVLVKVLEDPVI
ncbi:aminoglycoside phosphotransferase family protein [Streptomyces sp. CA-210063]|uniref:aminoglycoside phosphotransferase family protein n=1 Tax=Streptomyces sp. CA-210063 TaxID=2801029 RepID=UPI00214B57AA|nr:aminoglycoside phosphotransferase family protein [Streptomyces sp. CA-210063]UUU30677.1 aminoglycoside phosphotransferase family protein [Streptomyces sp. CA-210063]